MSNITRQEQETIIVFNAADKTANVSSLDPVWQRKIKKLKGYKQVGDYFEVDVPKTWIKIQQPRNLSPETKAKLSARAKTLSKTRKKNNV